MGTNQTVSPGRQDGGQRSVSLAAAEPSGNAEANSLGRLLETVHHAARRFWWNLWAKPHERTIARVKMEKERQRLAGLQYNEAPLVSIIVQSFNQVRNIAFLESRLRNTCMNELIVCEDGSLDGSLEEWTRRLTRPNDFLIRSNDLHEIRAYDRAIALARGEIICLMQDDDRPPKDGAWLAEAVQLFNDYPQLAVLGGWVGFMNYFAQEYNAPWQLGDRDIPFEHPDTGRPFMFVENVNIGPYLLRRSIYAELGGFDLRFSDPGAPGICFESELCYRAWKRGYQVGLTDLPVKAPIENGYPLPGGTLLWGKQQRERNEQLNKKRIVELHGRHLPVIQAMVAQANGRLRPMKRTADQATALARG
ncbi:MAG: glycosyltransferase [Alphaproteobacteria bacterium]